MINRHEAFDYSEVKRVLKPDGIFITQQVGDRNNFSLSSYLIDGYISECTPWNMDTAKRGLEDVGFEIIYSDEAFPYLKFFDAGL